MTGNILVRNGSHLSTVLYILIGVMVSREDVQLNVIFSLSYGTEICTGNLILCSFVVV